MSSHHFVKEGQEPALFILDPVAFELAIPFLEWAPLVLVSEFALNTVLLWGIKIDAVLTRDTREAITVEKLTTQVPIEIVSFRSEESPIWKALHYMINVKQAGVNVLTTRPEDVFPHAEVVRRQLFVNVVDPILQWSGISTGHFEKWVVSNYRISVRKSIDSQSIVVKGLIEIDGCFESNSEGPVTVQSDEFFWVAETHT